MTGLADHGRAALAGLILLLASALAVPAAAAEDEIVIRPEVVTISAFFSGVQMEISADLPPGSQAVLRVRGKRIEEKVMRKSHHWELWMNSGEVDIDHVPLLHIVLSSDPSLLSPEITGVPWSYRTLEKRAKFTGRLKPSEDMTIFKEFVQLMERDKLYRLYPGGLKISRLSPDRWQAQASFPLPSRIRPGAYRVALWVVQGGQVVQRRDASFQVKREGVPDFLSSLASRLARLDQRARQGDPG